MRREEVIEWFDGHRSMYGKSDFMEKLRELSLLGIEAEAVRPEERTTAPQPPLNPPVITESVGLAAEAVLAGKHCESLASEAIDLTVKLLREIARRTPEVLTYTDIEAFIMNELNPAKVMANKDRTSCYGLMGLLAKERARRSPRKE